MFRILLGFLTTIVLVLTGSFARQYYKFIKNQKTVLEADLESDNIGLEQKIKEKTKSNTKVSLKGK